MIEISNYIDEDSIVGRIIRISFTFFIKLIRKMMISSRNENSRVIIISLNRLGDTVFTIPAIRSIKNKFNDSFSIVCYEESKLIYQLVFKDLQFITLGKDDFYLGGRIANSRIRKRISDLQAGIIIDMTGSVKSASLIFNSRAKEIIGSNDKYFSAVYTEFITKRKQPHLIDKYLDVSNKISGIQDVIELKEYKAILNKDGYILIHPFAGWKAKEWNLSKFIELAISIGKRLYCKIIIPKEFADEKTLATILSLGISYVILYELKDLIEGIKNCSAIIGNDSGAIYIANILGKPTFTIYGPTNPSYSLPFGDTHDFIRKEIKCSPGINVQYCFADAGRKCTSFECMNMLTLEEVNMKINLFLDKTGLSTDGPIRQVECKTSEV
ncbi:MAG: glycosyltransferase family 9 protein [Ignavibacteriaceae bacterium]